jgi:hypothetical protein
MELDGVILRWKKTTRALKIHEQEYGRHLTDVLERVTEAQLVHFQDPVEAAAFFCMLDILKKTREGKSGSADTGTPSRQTILTGRSFPVTERLSAVLEQEGDEHKPEAEKAEKHEFEVG